MNFVLVPVAILFKQVWLTHLSMARASWENRPADWELPPADPGGGEVGVGEEPDGGEWDLEADACYDEDLSAEAAGSRLADYLIEMHIAGKLSAKLVCEISWFASKAGAVGEVATLMYKPGASTGNYSRHLKRALGLDAHAKELYKITLPGQNKFDLGRTTLTCPAVPPHEALENDFLQHPQMQEELMSSVESAEWAPTYYSHPVVRNADSLVVPVAIYMDGFPYTKHDAILGITVYNLLTSRRHLSVVLVKSKMCRCGCKG